ncbi:hypothetical protein LCGC14_1449390 [marine sediment metagenome]|uniref:Polymerase/histidinol phosphatase N-terminal domain-containing protein n=2 Tax=root TaxID=1 RepID=A0A831VUW4_9FLAO|nr:hypothetical protein [Pricia antarctica]
MKNCKITLSCICTLLYMAAFSQKEEIPFGNLQVYSGNTHAHSIFTYSHGNHLQKKEGFVKGDKILVIDSLYLSRPVNTYLKKDWEMFQGLPEKHYSEAKETGFDFYTVTDHSQEEAFYPTYENNTAWIIAQKQAEIASDENFTAFMGVEHSENDSDNGKGHFNVIGPSTYINAIRPGIDIPYFYNWLKQNPNNEKTGNPVVVTFNHPAEDQYNNWEYRDDEITEIITLLEVINKTKSHYPGFLAALEKGWKVSPVAGMDNHDYTSIKEIDSRTFVLAESNTPKDILEAMRKRRTYATFDKNLECRYAVNDSIMGATIPKAKKYEVDIFIKDPDSTDASDRISKIDIVTSGNKVLKTFQAKGSKHEVHWNVSLLQDEVEKFLFVRVWGIPSETASSSEPAEPIAWLAPVWILE